MTSWTFAKPKGKEKDPWSLQQPAEKKRKLAEDQEMAEKDEWDDSLELTQADLAEMDVIVSQAVQGDTTVRPDPGHDTEASFLMPGRLSPTSAGTSSTASSSKSNSLFSRPMSSMNSLHSSKSSLNNNDNELTKIKQDLEQAREDKYRSEGEVRFLRNSLQKQEVELERLRQAREEAAELKLKERSERETKLQKQLDSQASQAQFKERELLEQKEQVRKLLHKQAQEQQSTQGLSSSPKPPTSSPRKVPVRPSPPSKAMQAKIEKGGDSQAFPTTFSFMKHTKGQRPANAQPSTTSNACQTVTAPEIQHKEQTTCIDRKHKLKVPSSCNRGSSPAKGTEVVSQMLHMSCDPGAGLVGLLQAMSTSMAVGGLTHTRGPHGSLLSPVKPKRHELASVSSSAVHHIVSRAHLTQAVEGLTTLMEGEGEQAHKLLEHIAKTTQILLPTAINSRIVNGNSLHNDCNGTTPADSSTHGLEHTPAPSPSLPDHKNHLAAFLLFPLLTDYLQHYLELVQSGSAPPRPPSVTQDTSRVTASGSASTLTSMSTSYDSSLDSLSSGVQQLLCEGRLFASQMEAFACSSIRTLLLLLRLCPALPPMLFTSLLTSGRRLNKMSSTSTLSSSSAASAASKRHYSDHEADDERSTSSSEAKVSLGASSSSHLSSLASDSYSEQCCHLVSAVVSLASQDSGVSPLVVQLALRVLTKLCSQRDQIDNMEVAPMREILQVGLRQSYQVHVSMWAGRLLAALSASNTVFTQLCSRSENCPLYLMYRLAVCRSHSTSRDERICVYSAFLQSVSQIVYQHRRSLSLLLSAQCPCAEELVPAVIVAVDALLTHYKASSLVDIPTVSSHSLSKDLIVQSLIRPHDLCSNNPQDSLSPHLTSTQTSVPRSQLLSRLAEGVTLLHSLVQTDSQFPGHHARVQMLYVRSIEGVAREMKVSLRDQDSGWWELHLPALDELCHTEPDIGLLSQEEVEEEDGMDQA